MKHKTKPGLTSLQRVLSAVLFSNTVSVLILVMRIAETESMRYWFLLWNLILAWLPLVFAWWLTRRLPRTPWVSWQNVLLTLLWLGFLPNSFYLVSDLIHLHETGEVSMLYDAVMFVSFIFNGFLVGIASIMLVHRQLLRRFVRYQVHLVIGTVLLAASFAIYLGRVLRWNTWDILVNPAGILFDVSERFINPLAHDQVFVTTGLFFLLLCSVYTVCYQLVHFLRPPADKR